MIFLWDYYGISIGFLCYFYGISRVVLWNSSVGMFMDFFFSIGFLSDFYVISIVFL